MEYFGSILALISCALLALIYAYSSSGLRARLKNRVKLPKKSESARAEPVLEPVESWVAPEPPAEEPKPKPGPLQPDSKVVTVRVVPLAGESFGAESLVLFLRSAGFQHGEFDIFHKLDPEGSGRIRYSVASLVEPGAFDLSKLKESVYPGISLFMVLPAPEDGLALFDEMVASAHRLAKELDGQLADEQGSLFSVQRERYMREEVIAFLRQQLKVGDPEDMFEFGD